ncbi:MAG: glycoside hydrolase family 28 protein [Limisphaerales bacterium]
MKLKYLFFLPGLLSAAALAAPIQAPHLPVIPKTVFDVTHFGAVGDGRTLDTQAIQKTIDAAAAANGGVVRVPAGKFLTGPFTLDSRINLRLDRGAVLLISDDMAHYPIVKHRYQDSITVSHAHDVEISGNGVIDGQGAAWWSAFRSNPRMTHRPYMIKITDCSRVLVSGVTLQNSPMFHLVPENCTDVTIRNIHIHAPSNAPNTDGIDPSGWNFLITGCSIDTGDDDIAIKPTGGRHPGDKNFLIQDCAFGHGHGCSVGGGTFGGVEDVIVRHCSFDQTDAGIRIKSARDRGGLLQNVTYENLRMKHVKHPIYIYDFYPEHNAPRNPADAKPAPVTGHTPFDKNIVIRNVTATDCPSAGTIYGLPEMPIDGVIFSNVNLSADAGMQIYYARNIQFQDSKITVRTGRPLVTYDAQVTGFQSRQNH